LQSIDETTMDFEQNGRESSDERMAAMRFAILLSGTGRTLENLIQARDRGELDGEIAIVVSSRPGVRGLDVARGSGIPAVVVDRRTFASDLDFSEAVYDTIAPYQPQMILLAGFLRQLHVPAAWEGRILNIHPALLPEMEAVSGRGFYGDRVHAAVLESGVRRSGATVHVVDNGYDTGLVVQTEEVPVLESDTVQDLAARVFAAECRLYPRAIARYVAEHASWIRTPPETQAPKSQKSPSAS
jgi:phosphoribosylglycinamide formyltransferase 1